MYAERVFEGPGCTGVGVLEKLSVTSNYTRRATGTRKRSILLRSLPPPPFRTTMTGPGTRVRARGITIDAAAPEQIIMYNYTYYIALCAGMMGARPTRYEYPRDEPRPVFSEASERWDAREATDGRTDGRCAPRVEKGDRFADGFRYSTTLPPAPPSDTRPTYLSRPTSPRPFDKIYWVYVRV